jgi:hypothetical protein
LNWLTPEERTERAKRSWETRRRNRGVVNHLIVSIRNLPPEPVYDFEVPGFHAALVGSGIVVHNCNTQCYFKIRNGALDIVVTCRSNDTVFGAYGSNVIQFSILLEYMAAMICVPVGRYWQVSDSWHAYTSRWKEFGGFSEEEYEDYYITRKIKHYSLVEHSESFDEELSAWMNRDAWVFEAGFKNSFFPLVAEPLYLAWQAYKNNDLGSALVLAARCEAEDWRIGAMNFFHSIRRKRQAKGK